jgi:hypothetical protein
MPADWDQSQRAYFRRRSIREQAVAYKGGCCEICGYNQCLSALEFHHPDPIIKEFNIADRVTSFEVIRGELDKCHLLCANHHREVHDGLHPQYLITDNYPPVEFGPVDDDLSYLEELELNEAVADAVLSLSSEIPPKKLRSSRTLRNKEYGNPLRRS